MLDTTAKSACGIEINVALEDDRVLVFEIGLIEVILVLDTEVVAELAGVLTFDVEMRNVVAELAGALELDVGVFDFAGVLTIDTEDVLTELAEELEIDVSLGDASVLGFKVVFDMVLVLETEAFVELARVLTFEVEILDVFAEINGALEVDAEAVEVVLELAGSLVFEIVVDVVAGFARVLNFDVVEFLDVVPEVTGALNFDVGEIDVDIGLPEVIELRDALVIVEFLDVVPELMGARNTDVVIEIFGLL